MWCIGTQMDSATPSIVNLGGLFKISGPHLTHLKLRLIIAVYIGVVFKYFAVMWSKEYNLIIC
jgi:hypothetical protein